MSTRNNNHVGISISKEVILNIYDNKLTVPGYASNCYFACFFSIWEEIALYKKYCHAN